MRLAGRQCSEVQHEGCRCKVYCLVELRRSQWTSSFVWIGIPVRDGWSLITQISSEFLYKKCRCAAATLYWKRIFIRFLLNILCDRKGKAEADEKMSLHESPNSCKTWMIFVARAATISTRECETKTNRWSHILVVLLWHEGRLHSLITCGGSMSWVHVGEEVLRCTFCWYAIGNCRNLSNYKNACRNDARTSCMHLFRTTYNVVGGSHCVAATIIMMCNVCWLKVLCMSRVSPRRLPGCVIHRIIPSTLSHDIRIPLSVCVFSWNSTAAKVNLSLHNIFSTQNALYA